MTGMVEQDRSCIDALTQISPIRSALDSVPQPEGQIRSEAV